jgi:ech hydrogenase subunit D
MLEITNVDRKDLIAEVTKLKSEGYRLSTISCESLSQEECEVTYHFDKDYALVNLRVTTKYTDSIESISHQFPAALLHENEYQDMMGVKFDNLLIDYKGHLLLAKDAPLYPQR